MAKHNSIDLSVRSQDLLTAFLQHYTDNAAPWFIMNSDGEYLLHSRTVPELFKLKNTNLYGKTDEELGVLSKNYRRRNKKIRTTVMSKSLRIITLEIHLFYCDKHYTPLVYITEPFLFGDEKYTITRVIDVCSLRRFSFMSYNKMLSKESSTDSVLEKPVREFSELNPLDFLNDSQWCALWLCLMGYSYRDISKITGRNLKNTAELLNRSFRTLNVHTLKNFLY
ncbi:hypothetical protein ACX297_004999, partial [Escherichia coli]